MERSFCLALIAVVISMVTAQELNIQPADKKAKVGENVIFSCAAAEQHSVESLGWRDLNGNTVSQDSNNNRIYEEMDGTNTARLFINVIEERDAGFYTCEGKVNGVDKTKQAELDVYLAVSFVNPKDRQHPTINSEALIECTAAANPSPIMSWYKEGVQIRTGGRYRLWDLGLYITNITKDDNGYYECRAAVYAVGDLQTLRIEVDVYTPPRITSLPSSVSGTEDQQVSLKCEAEGYPDPEFFWYKGESNIPLVGERYLVDLPGSLRIRDLAKTDEGEYTCEAKNPADSAYSTVDLSVFVPPRLVGLINKTVDEGKDIYLECEVSGDQPMEMVFQRVGNDAAYVPGPQPDDPNIEVEDIEVGAYSTKLRLIFRLAKPKYRANYTCMATNNGGYKHINGTIIVNYKPIMDFERSDDIVKNWLGNRRNISCYVESEPPPYQIVWLKNGVIVQDSATTAIYKNYFTPNSHNSSLEISVTDGQQAQIFGEYTCNATNRLGWVQHTVTVEQAFLPAEPASVSVLETTPRSIKLDIIAPTDNGGLDVYEYRISYQLVTEDDLPGGAAVPLFFATDDDIVIDGLSPAKNYNFKISAKNEVGYGKEKSFSAVTAVEREPDSVAIKSLPDSQYADAYDLEWEVTGDGGTQITAIILKYSEAGSDDWVTSEQKAARQSLNLKNLKADTSYEVTVQAKNAIGISPAQDPPFRFKTKKDNNYTKKPTAEPTTEKGGLGTGAIIAIVIILFLLILIIIDVTCYFRNHCGLLMCICVNCCGKTPPSTSEKEALKMEEGTNDEKKPLDDEDKKADQPLLGDDEKKDPVKAVNEAPADCMDVDVDVKPDAPPDSKKTAPPTNL